MMDYYGNGMTGGMLLWGGLALIFLVAIVAAIAFLVAFFVKRASGSRGAIPGEPAPEDILRHRFAAGDIDDEEFKRRLAALK